VLRQFDPEYQVDAMALGADVPVCRGANTAMMRGIGERVDALSGLGQVFAVLVNPRISVSTGAIFHAYDTRQNTGDLLATQMHGTLLERAKAGRNDLEPFAIEQAPIIQQVLESLSATPKCQLARMSGSGATCFALYGSEADAQNSASLLAENHPGWWVKCCRLGDE